MSAWRRVALAKMPKCRRQIEKADNIMMLWIDLWLEFERAYQGTMDEELIASVYSYASWCLAHSNNSDLQTAAIVRFYEHLPRNEAIRKDLPNRLTRADFLGLKEVFKYFLSEEEHREFVSEFLEQADRRLTQAFAKKKKD